MVLTKCDLVGRQELARRVAVLRDELADLPYRMGKLPVVLVSSLDGAKGVRALQRELGALTLTRQPQAAATASRQGGTTSGQASASSTASSHAAGWPGKRRAERSVVVYQRGKSRKPAQ